VLLDLLGHVAEARPERRTQPQFLVQHQGGHRPARQLDLGVQLPTRQDRQDLHEHRQGQAVTFGRSEHRRRALDRDLQVVLHFFDIRDQATELEPPKHPAQLQLGGALQDDDHPLRVEQETLGQGQVVAVQQRRPVLELDLLDGPPGR
jgi:hypothetical protein